MRLIYLETGAPGEGDDALNHARSDDERVLFRTADNFQDTEACRGVYTNREEIQEEYAVRDVPVWNLNAEEVEVDTDRKRYAVGEHKGGGYYPVIDRQEEETVETATKAEAERLAHELNNDTE